MREARLSPLELILAGTAVEGAILLAEVPTGVVADTVSRRFSVILGLCVTALGFALMAAVPTFAFVLVGHAVWGVGYTFGSGAREAWLADEVGDDVAGSTYVRAAQLAQLGGLAAIAPGVLVALVDLQLPILAAGACFLGGAVFLAWRMPETGFRAGAGALEAGAPEAGATAWRRLPLVPVLLDGMLAVRGSVVLLSLVAAWVVGGASSEVFDRLYPLHFLESFSIPSVASSERLGEVGWFGVLAAGSHLGAIAVTGLVARFVDVGMGRALARALLVLMVATIALTLVFARTEALLVALLAFWAVNATREASSPLALAWANRGLEPRTRATVLSMLGQADALGQVVGGPVLGLVAAARSVRTALTLVAVVLVPSLAVYARLAVTTTGEAPSDVTDGEPR